MTGFTSSCWPSRARFSYTLPEVINAEPACSYPATWSAADRCQQDSFQTLAPDANSVHLAIAGGETLPMQAEDDGWYCLEAPYGAGTLYRFWIDEELHVPDPASRAQAGDVHAPSLVVANEDHLWKHNDWQGRPWHETVLYELHVGTLGGYAGVERQLADLAALGVTAIELMPLAEFPGDRNWGYDGVLPYAPEASYGTPAELKHLIDTAHGLGLMVFLDVVYNHFGPDGNYLGRYAKHFFRHDQQTRGAMPSTFAAPRCAISSSTTR